MEFLKGDCGSDLIEYTLILAFVCLTGAALYIGMSTNENALWQAVNNQLEAPNEIR